MRNTSCRSWNGGGFRLAHRSALPKDCRRGCGGRWLLSCFSTLQEPPAPQPHCEVTGIGTKGARRTRLPGPRQHGAFRDRNGRRNPRRLSQRRCRRPRTSSRAALRASAPTTIRRSSSRCARKPRSSPRRATLARAGDKSLPLYGIPVAVKDNIDVEGLPTTAACPAFAYRPSKDATAVARLRAAGALILGKTNLDQFATGLVGVRTPYGIPRNLFDAKLIPGGSSTGSALAVGGRLVPLALGTDTAGSGRVPAALQQHRRPQAEPRPGLDRRRRARLPHARLRVGVRASPSTTR